MLETGQAGSLRVAAVEGMAAALGGRVDLRLFWNGPELDRMLDAAHAALGAVVKRRLQRWGWLVRVEVSYSRYGERGRIDLLALHPPTGTLLVVELKSELVDVQSLLGSLDAKARLARHVARGLGWEPGTVVPAIVFVASSTTRKRLIRLDPLFDRYAVRGRSATSWLRRPHAPVPFGLLWFAQLKGSRQPAPARHRVRVRVGDDVLPAAH